MICIECKENWNLVGKSYIRKDNKVDYFCTNCKSKRKPLDYENKNIINNLKSLIKKPKVIKKPKNILCIGDLHEPFTLKGYFSFCKKIYNKYNCDHAIFMGDIIDNHYASFHSTDPDGLSAGDELDYAINKLKKWGDFFKNSDVCIGNHDLLILRKAFKEGVSKRWIRDFHEVLEVDWDFHPSFEYNNCLFRHGLNMKASTKALSEMMNTIQGHFHTESFIHYRVGRGKKVFGMQVPCGVDREAYAMAYAKEFPKQSIGCSVVLENGRLPIVEMMDL